jgi:hypothetical protein
MLTYVVKDLLRTVNSPCYIAHCCNDKNGFGSGFAGGIAMTFPDVKAAYHSWFGGSGGDSTSHLPMLGEVQFVTTGNDITFCNIIGQRGYGKPGPRYVDYDAIRDGLIKVADRYVRNPKPVYLPKLGAGLAGGEWSVISQIIEEELTARNVPVTVFVLEQREIPNPEVL